MLIYLQIWIITFTTISLSPHFVLPVPFDDDEDRSLVLWRPQLVEMQSFYFFCESEGRYSFHFLRSLSGGWDDDKLLRSKREGANNRRIRTSAPGNEERNWKINSTTFRHPFFCSVFRILARSLQSKNKRDEEMSNCVGGFQRETFDWIRNNIMG